MPQTWIHDQDKIRLKFIAFAVQTNNKQTREKEENHWHQLIAFVTNLADSFVKSTIHIDCKKRNKRHSISCKCKSATTG